MGQRALDVHPEAVAEIRAAHLRYAEHSAETSEPFFAEVEAGLERIAQLPETWPSYLHGTRRFLLRRFPFSIVYRVTDETIGVYALAHAKRRPGYWKSRRL